MDSKNAAGNASNHQMNRQVSDMESIYEEMPAKGQKGRRRRKFLPDASLRRDDHFCIIQDFIFGSKSLLRN